MPYWTNCMQNHFSTTLVPCIVSSITTMGQKVWSFLPQKTVWICLTSHCDLTKWLRMISWHSQTNSQVRIRTHSHLAQLSRTMLKHECPPCPLPADLHSHCSSLTAPEHAWAVWSTESDPYFYLNFFHLLIKFLNCSLVSALYKTVTNFSTALYADIVCCCLPEFKVNPPLIVTMMSAFRACACAHASVQYWSPPLPTVPGPTQRAMLEYGTERSH